MEDTLQADTLQEDTHQAADMDFHHLTAHLRLNMDHPATKATALLESISEEFVKDTKLHSTSRSLMDILKEAVVDMLHHLPTELHQADMECPIKFPITQRHVVELVLTIIMFSLSLNNFCHRFIIYCINNLAMMILLCKSGQHSSKRHTFCYVIN